MGIALSNFGLLTGATETTPGTEEAPTIGLRTIGQPTYANDESFDAIDFLTLEPSFEPGARVKKRAQLDFNAAVLYMNDALTDQLDHLPMWEAAGFEVHDTGLATGTGNFIELRTVATPTKTSTFHGFYKESGGKLSRKKHVGAAGNITLSLQAGAENPLQAAFAGFASWAFWEEFTDIATLSPPSRSTQAPHKSSCWSMTIDGDTVPLVGFSYSPNFTIVDNGDDVTNCDSGIAFVELEAAQQGGSVSIKFDEALIASGGANHVRQVIEADTDKLVVIERNDGVQLWRATMPRVRFQEIGTSEGNNRLQFDMDFVAQATAPGQNDQITIRSEIL